MARVTVNISLDVDSYEKLMKYCNVLGLSRSQVVNFLLKDSANSLVLELACNLVKTLKQKCY